MRILTVQTNPLVGDLENNFLAIQRTVENNPTVDLIIFPECALTGYPLNDLVLRPHFIQEVARYIDQIQGVINQAKGPAVIYGAPTASGVDKPFNSAVFAYPGGRVYTNKTNLPNDDVFDEQRTFSSGASNRVISHQGTNIGIMICEDMWHDDVVRQWEKDHVDFVVVINGSPMEQHKQFLRQEHAQRIVSQANAPLLYVNMVGGQDDVVFDGASFVLSHKGDLIAQAPAYTEHQMYLQYDNYKMKPVTSGSAIHDYPDTEEAAYLALVLGTRDYFRKNGFKKAILGLSGGLDSALVAAIAADAIGAHNVFTVMLPTQFTSQDSLDLAEEMAERTGIAYTVSPITSTVADQHHMSLNAIQSLGFATEDKSLQLMHENIQARLRGVTLMSLTNAMPDALLLSTGNKSEVSVGYSTLYGDMCGGFNPLKDVYKTMVSRLAVWRNAQIDLGYYPLNGAGNQPIPAKIISRPPSAELAEGQVDEKALGSYSMLDAVLEHLVEAQLSPKDTHSALKESFMGQISLEYIQKISALLKKAEFKRRQSAPGIKITRRSFGLGWRYPITNRYQF